MTAFQLSNNNHAFACLEEEEATKAEVLRLMDQHDYAQAEQLASALVSRNPQWARGYQLVGAALFAQGRRLEAEPLLVHAYNLDVRCMETGKVLIAAARELGRIDTAWIVAHELLKHHPDDLDLRVAADQLTELQHQRNEPGFYMQFFDEGDLVFDVGANIGNLTAEFLRNGAGRVIGFDPQPSSLETLHHRFDGNKNVVIVSKALGSQPGTITLSICSQGSGLSTCAEHWKQGRYERMEWDRRIDVEVTTLNAMIAEFGLPAYCKIDVEGYEYQVLQGLSQPIPCLSFEFTREFISDVERCLSHLQTLGFTAYNAIVGDKQELLFDPWVTSSALIRALRDSPDRLLYGDIFARS